MEMERAIETQRLALLRLLAGWQIAVAVLTAAPFAPAFTRWVCGLVFSVLLKAEAAAECLVFVQARLIASERGGSVDLAWPSRTGIGRSGDVDEPPCPAELCRRLKALRRLLDDLPKHGRRLLRRIQAARDASAVAVRLSDQDAALSGGRTVRFAAHQCALRAPWHPPRLALTF